MKKILFISLLFIGLGAVGQMKVEPFMITMNEISVYHKYNWTWIEEEDTMTLSCSHDIFSEKELVMKFYYKNTTLHTEILNVERFRQFKKLVEYKKNHILDQYMNIQ